METEKCKALLYALNSGTITQAAKDLGYTISGISKMIYALEQETGLPLLTRGKSGVGMTEECKRLLPYMRQLVVVAENFSQTVHELQGLNSGIVRIGTSFQSYFQNLVSIIADFKKDYPNIQIKLIDETSSRLYEMLNNGELDLAIISRRDAGNTFVHISEDEIVAWLPVTEENLQKKFFTLEELKNSSYIDSHPGKETDNSLLLKKMGIHIESKYTASEVYAAKSMVEAGLGVALINRLWAEDIGGNVLILSLEPQQFVELGLAAKEDLGPAAKRFKEYLMSSEKLRQV